MKQLPVILITGFLGAGKTTFVNKLLFHLRESGKSVALLINEFGLVNIDSALIETDDEPVYEVNQGSIFCVCTRDQFLKALDGITNHSPAFDVAIIESTGLANTRDIGEYLSMAPFNGTISVKQNYCIIDAKNFHKVLSTLPAVRTQVEEASICVVNKTDLVDGEYLNRLDEILTSINSKSNIIHTNYCDVIFEEHIDLSTKWSAGTSIDTEPPGDISSLSLKAKGTYNRKMTVNFLENISGDLLRAKGFMKFDDGPVYIELAGDNLMINTDETPEKHDCNLVLIGKLTDTYALKKRFRKCKISVEN